MVSNDRLRSAAFPRASKYHPDWLIASASGGANSVWLAEWLASALELRPGMRVLDLGSGRAASSIFLHREFGVEVWATDLWFSASENLRRIRDAGVERGVFPIHADARELPFAAEFFDAVVAIDSFYYYGTDEHFLRNLARFVKPGGQIALAGAGMVREIEGPLPAHLEAWWTPEAWSLHSADWWRRQWERSEAVDVELADSMPDGWRRWVEWHRAVAPDNAIEIDAIEADAGRNLGYVRVVARRRPDVVLEEPLRSLPPAYTAQPLLRETGHVR
jgi:SAM-dependent methyltransferase